MRRGVSAADGSSAQQPAHCQGQHQAKEETDLKGGHRKSPASNGVI
jgi:hypothetical protein